VRVALTAISEERSLAGATARVSSGRGIVTSFMAAAAQELLLSSDVIEREGVKERVASRLACSIRRSKAAAVLRQRA
jgi:hypothetical protein